MDIYILRHGIAEPHAQDGRDETRALTEDGRTKLRAVLERARAAKAAPSLILTSPYVRAVQTAEIAAKELGYKKRIVKSDALAPDSSPEAVWAEIRSHAKEKALLVAGHEPLLSATVSFLVGSGRTVVELKKGALARISIEAPAKTPQGVLAWLITPKLAQ
ncbi:MAG: phosphohistidine phosphatase SixA [Acidobacteriota bacterium]